jgi:hypothetical protein
MLFSVAVLGLLAGVAVAAPTRNATTKPQSAVVKTTSPPKENTTFGHLPTHQASDVLYRYRYHFRGYVLDFHDPLGSPRLKLLPVRERGNLTIQANPRPSALYLREEPQQIDLQR